MPAVDFVLVLLNVYPEFYWLEIHPTTGVPQQPMGMKYLSALRFDRLRYCYYDEDF